jgi:hypothetical protein
MQPRVRRAEQSDTRRTASEPLLVGEPSRSGSRRACHQGLPAGMMVNAQRRTLLERAAEPA